MALGLVAIISFEAVDLLFIAQLGTEPLAAVSFTFPIISLLSGIGIGFEAGIASCVSRAVGKGEHERGAQLTTDGMILAGLAILAISLLGLFTIEPLFTLLGAGPELLGMIGEYMRIWYLVEPIAIVLWSALAAMRARGNTRFEANVIIAAAVLNLILDPLLIFGLLGFPQLGVQGAALASLISYTVVTLAAFGYLNRLKDFFGPIDLQWARLRASWRSLLHIGVPAMISNAVIPLAGAIVLALVAKYGIYAVAGFGVAMRIEPLALIPFYALSAVSSPFAGQNFAASKFHRVMEQRRVISLFCLIFGLSLAAVLALVAKPIASLFSDSPEILQVATWYLWIVAPSYGAYGLVMSANASFNGIGKPAAGVFLSVNRVLVLFFPLAWVGRELFGLYGLFSATTLCNIIVAWMAFVLLGRAVRAGAASA